MQHEIAAAQAEVSRHEDLVLERMLEADELAGQVKQAEATLKNVQTKVAAERTALDEEVRQLEARLEQTAADRAALVAEINPSTLSVFETVARGRRGCHVRIRPQVFNEVRRNDTIIQCDSCQRILYFVPLPAQPAATAPDEARARS
jgi:predicted  nucleic acid-binding Zn-ribbon protein